MILFFIQARYRKLPLFSVFSLSAFAIAFYYHPLGIPVFTAPILSPQKIVDWSVAFGSLRWLAR